MNPNIDKYRKELKRLNLNTVEDLEKIIKPLIRASTKLEAKETSKPKGYTQLISHFGGQPYFEKGEE